MGVRRWHDRKNLGGNALEDVDYARVTVRAVGLSSTFVSIPSGVAERSENIKTRPSTLTASGRRERLFSSCASRGNGIAGCREPSPFFSPSWIQGASGARRTVSS